MKLYRIDMWNVMFWSPVGIGVLAVSSSAAIRAYRVVIGPGMALRAVEVLA
jgi:hypothetical protein